MRSFIAFAAAPSIVLAAAPSFAAPTSLAHGTAAPNQEILPREPTTDPIHRTSIADIILESRAAKSHKTKTHASKGSDKKGSGKKGQKKVKHPGHKSSSSEHGTKKNGSSETKQHARADALAARDLDADVQALITELMQLITGSANATSIADAIGNSNTTSVDDATVGGSNTTDIDIATGASNTTDSDTSGDVADGGDSDNSTDSGSSRRRRSALWTVLNDLD